MEWKSIALALGATGFGWALAQVSSWWSNRGQRQRTRKRMLFYLLELEYLIARMDVEREVDYMIRSIHTKAGVAFTPEEQQKVRTQVRPMLVRMAVEWSLPELDALEKGYHDAVEELSYVAPFIAYRLKGRTGLLKRFELVRGLIDKVPSLDPSVTSEHQQAFADFFESLSPNAIHEDLGTIRSELVSLSWWIGLIALWKAKRRVRRSSTLSADDEKDMEEYLEQLIGFMMQRFPNGVPPASATMPS